MQYSVGVTGGGLGLAGMLLATRHEIRLIQEPLAGCGGAWECLVRYWNLDDATFLGVSVASFLLMLSAGVFSYFVWKLCKQFIADLTQRKINSRSSATSDQDGGQVDVPPA